MNKKYLIPFLLLGSASVSAGDSAKNEVRYPSATNYAAQNGLVAIEAEDFVHQANDQTRRWLRFDKSTPKHDLIDADDTHVKGASHGAYIELLPDTRTKHTESLAHGVNFSEKAGEVGVISYPIYFDKPGRYYVWARAYSTGTEDNGLHVGLNGEWPESGKRLQFCEGKFKWTWSSAQRTKENHCGVPRNIFIDVDSVGVHTLQISMREDGTELDKLILTQDRSYTPEGAGPKRTLLEQAELPNTFGPTSGYVLYATQSFSFKKPVYKHTGQNALAIDATIKKARNKFYRASHKITDIPAGKYAVKLETLSELDGESEYRVFLNKKLVGEFKNPETKKDYKSVAFDLGVLEINSGDKISVESNAVSNGKIPENDEYAYSRGRWRSIIFKRDNPSQKKSHNNSSH